jgi:4-amino-4-deoxy-L-arabinose transferase-like glycosyltransferase
MRVTTLLAVALIAAALLLADLGRAPFVDPPEGIHAEIAREMLRSGDWITPHLDGIPYFDKPPLLYWLMAASFAAFGCSEWSARLWSTLPAIAVAVLTARIGILLGSVRVGLIAGLMVMANLEVFVFSRIVKPDLLFVSFIVLAFTAFIEAYLGGRRRALFLFYAALGLSALAKDVMGVLGPLAVIALFFHVTGEPGPWRRWAPWAAIAVLLAIAVPWYGVLAWRQRGFFWYTVVDNHILFIVRRRVFPDEDVPLSALQFIGVTAAGFVPWVVALPQAIWRVLSRARGDARERLWLLLALWTVSVLGLFTFAPFKLSHYALPAFPAMALLVARFCNEAFEGAAGARSTRAVLLPSMLLLALLAAVCGLAAGGVLDLPTGVMTVGDVAAWNVNTQVGVSATAFLERTRPLLGMAAVIFALATGGVALAAWRRHVMIGVGAMLAGMMAFLPVSGQGLTMFAHSRSTAAMAGMAAARARPGDVLAHEGPIEDSASWLVHFEAPVIIVDGRLSSLAFGSTLASSRDLVWGREDLAEAWRGDRRVFLLSVVRAKRSVVNDLPPVPVYLLLDAGGRRLYSNRP